MSVNAGAGEPEADREVIITRTYDAPMDFRKGGQWRAAMTGPGGEQQTPFGGEYLEIVPNRRIVFSNGFELPGAEKMIWTVTFDEKDGKTLLSIRTLFASIAQKATHVGAGMKEGMASGLDQLTDVVAALKAAA
jgi:uncharacterized protein YndB with AHSA1/START domain